MTKATSYKVVKSGCEHRYFGKNTIDFDCINGIIALDEWAGVGKICAKPRVDFSFNNVETSVNLSVLHLCVCFFL